MANLDNVMVGVDAILEQRGAAYGDFRYQAVLARAFKDLAAPAYDNLEQRSDLHSSTVATIEEGMDMVLHKISRLLNGDITHLDSWDDIIGYATITVQRIRQDLNGEVQ